MCSSWSPESLPSRERGLKFGASREAEPALIVAPFTGAWIEIRLNARLSGEAGVAPFTGAWIEIPTRSFYTTRPQVAPFTGAWIEIRPPNGSRATGAVAPFTGAWIEISGPPCRSAPAGWSLPSRERGLKF